MKERAFQIAVPRARQNAKASRFAGIFDAPFAGMIDAATVAYRVWAKAQQRGQEISMTTTELLTKLRTAEGKTLLVECLMVQPLVLGEKELAQALAAQVRVEQVPFGTSVIAQGSSDHDLIFILAGDFFVTVGRQVISRRTAGHHIGEMALVDRDAPRSATVTSGSDAVIARISEPEFSALANRFPSLWRRMAQELAERLRRATKQGRYGRPTNCTA